MNFENIAYVDGSYEYVEDDVNRQLKSFQRTENCPIQFCQK